MKIDSYKEVDVGKTFDGVRLIVSVYDFPDDFSMDSLDTFIAVSMSPSQARQIARELLDAASPMFKTNRQGETDSDAG